MSGPKRVRRNSRLSRQRKPEGMSLEAWQVALRRQFASEQDFRVRNVGGRPIFSEFEITNPQTSRTYRVAVRGDGLGVNFCSCPDFATNTLGTCKHVEFLLGRLRRQPGGRAELARGYRPAYSEVYLRYGARREVVFQPGTECPGSLNSLAGRFFGDDGVLRTEAMSGFHRFLEQAAGNGAAGHEIRCYDDALAFISQVRDRAELIKRIEQAFPGGPDDPALAGLLRASLYPYQREGALFAAKAGRCLIADDMGLGKTVQAIAAAEILARHADIRRVLVVCPTSLKHQWRGEIEKFSGRSAVVVEGLAPVRDRLYATDAFYTIVNYDVVHRDLRSIRQQRFDLVVLDEAQRIKNWKTRAAKAVKQLDSDHAFVLTGTPLENRLEELHSIVEFVDRHRLGPMFRFLSAHQHVDDAGRVIGYRRLDEVARTPAPILLRRTKDAVLKDLPERLEKRFFVPMTEQQMRLHEDNREIVVRIVAKWRRFGYLSEIDQKRLTCALQNMRMSCDSTYLLDGQTDFGPKADELMALLGEILEDRDAKVVVFSQWLRMHELLTGRLGRRRWQHVLFHGGVPGPKRKDLVARFRQDAACRLFLSTDAGGVGLNLQHASVVANMDLPWNPAVLEQRIGRVHRLGQHRPVRVVNFIAKGTIEEGMLSLLTFKKSMFAGVLDGGDKEVFLGGTRLKKFMDTVEKAASNIAAPMPAGDGPGDGQSADAGPADGRGPGGHDAAGAGRPDVAMPPGVRPPFGEPGRAAGAPTGAAAPAALTPDALGNLLLAGAAFLQQLGRSLSPPPGTTSPTPGTPAAPPGGLLDRDGATGQTYLKLPLPSEDVIRPLLGLLGAYLGKGT